MNSATLNRHLAAAALALATATAATAARAQTAYPSAEAAADALVSAISTSDDAALRKVLGQDFRRFVQEDSISRDDIYAFLAAWAKHHEVASTSPTSADLVVGQQGWHFPVPMVKARQGWRFDLRQGLEEMRRRRIDRNEIAAIDTLRTLCAAQERYRASVGKGKPATRIMSRPGHYDGLFWYADPQAPSPSPLSQDALTMESDVPADAAFHGYRYALLNAADESGCAFAAWPATYGSSGRHSFMIGPDQKIVERDAGRQTFAADYGPRTSVNQASWTALQP